MYTSNGNLHRFGLVWVGFGLGLLVWNKVIVFFGDNNNTRYNINRIRPRAKGKDRKTETQQYIIIWFMVGLGFGWIGVGWVVLVCVGWKLINYCLELV